MTTINTINTINNIHDIINELSKFEINLVHKIYSIVIWDYMYDIIIDSINTKIKDIKNGYEIIYYEEDGCDDDGPMFWVDCINGWYGREWNVKSSMYNKINNYLNSIDICFIHKIVPEFSMNDKYEALKYYFNTKNPSLIIDIYFITNNNTLNKVKNEIKKYRSCLYISKNKLKIH